MFSGTSMPDCDWWQELWPHPNHTITALGITSEDSVLDLCCGDGWFTLPLAQTAHKTIALELDDKLLEEAKQFCAKQSKEIVWIEGDAMNLIDLMSSIGKVDVVFLANTFHGIPDKSSLSKLVHTVLKDNGRFIIVNWLKIPREDCLVLNLPRGPKTELRLSAEQCIDIIQPVGYEVDKVIDGLSPYHYGIIFKKDSYNQS